MHGRWVILKSLIPDRQKLHTPTRIQTKKKHPVALVRERTIPTERPPPVGEVSANFCG